MRESEMRQVHERLLALREELDSVASTSGDSSDVVELDQSRVGRLSRMDALQAQAMSQETDRRREKTLRGIAAALVRIDNGSYGNCESCEEPIATKRLLFDPTALLCIDCATNAEQ